MGFNIKRSTLFGQYLNAFNFGHSREPKTFCTALWYTVGFTILYACAIPTVAYAIMVLVVAPFIFFPLYVITEGWVWSHEGAMISGWFAASVVMHMLYIFITLLLGWCYLERMFYEVKLRLKLKHDEVEQPGIVLIYQGFKEKYCPTINWVD